MTDTAFRSAPSRGPILKLVLIAGLTVALLLPLGLMLGLIGERQARQASVEHEIGALWGRSQQLGGPILVVPARRLVVVDEPGENGRRPVRRVVEEPVVLLPDDYQIDATVQPETRRRGLFETVVYRLEVTLSGRFVLGPDTVPQADGVTIDWSAATLALGLSDQRSIREAPVVTWAGRSIALSPGLPTSAARLAAGGMQAPVVGLDPSDGERAFDFATTLSLNGSASVSFLPLGRTTTVSLASDWPHPSFFGRFLPDQREISDTGFTARWQTSYFGRPFPQVWAPGENLVQHFAELDHAAFGVRFYQPVDAYQQTERTVKYGILFIVFTFTALFLFEMLAGVRVHIFHYALVGLALTLFYMLVLALAEQIGFTAAYALGALAVVAQIAFYTAAVLGRASRTAGLAGLLAALYAGLWVLMQLEDYALLVGALALFAGLTAVMAVTRRVDWYAVTATPDRPKAPRVPERPST